MSVTLAVYISGHGYGHLAQLAPVLTALLHGQPRLRLLLRSELDETVIRRFLPTSFRLLPGAVDVGVVQHHAAAEDIPATIRAARRFFSDWEARVTAEITRMRRFRPALVLSDISPLAFPVARRLGVPAIALGSLDWHAIYSGYMPADDPLLALLAEAHTQADVLLQPPLSMPMPGFACTKRIGLIARRASRPRNALRRHLGITDNMRLGMVMFGGAGDPPFDVGALDAITGWQFGIPATEARRITPRLAHVPCTDGTTTADYVAAADVVICKPSYNILAECWRHRTSIVYVPRPGFPEYPYLRGWLEKNAPAAEISPAAFAAGAWEEALDQAIHSRRCYPDTDMNGDMEAARYIAACL